MTLLAYPTLAGLTFPVVRTPIWSTLKQDSWSGKSNPIALWSYPRRRYTLSYDFLRSGGGLAELQTLEAFFNLMQGSANAFSFTDPDDQTTTAASFGLGDGVTSTFQLARPRGVAPYLAYDPVFLPRAGFTLAINGTATTAFVTGSNPGQIIFSTPPANAAALTWTGSFDWLCRFDEDTYDFEEFMNQLWSLTSISFTTVKL